METVTECHVIDMKAILLSNAIPEPVQQGVRASWSFNDSVHVPIEVRMGPCASPDCVVDGKGEGLLIGDKTFDTNSAPRSCAFLPAKLIEFLRLWDASTL